MSEYHEFVAGLFALAGLTEIPPDPPRCYICKQLGGPFVYDALKDDIYLCTSCYLDRRKHD